MQPFVLASPYYCGQRLGTLHVRCSSLCVMMELDLEVNTTLAMFFQIC